MDANEKFKFADKKKMVIYVTFENDALSNARWNRLNGANTIAI